MRTLVFAFVCITFGTPAVVFTQQGQQRQPASPAAAVPGLHASAADVAAMVEKARAGMKPGQAAAGGWIVKVDDAVSKLGAVFPAGHVHLDYLVDVIPNAALIHERRSEFFYVMDGSGVVLVGGKLQNETRMNAETLRGSGVEGGTPQRLAKGDFFILPKGTPHFFSQIDGKLVFASLMIPQE